MVGSGAEAGGSGGDLHAGHEYCIPQGIKRFTCTGVIPGRQPSNLAYRHVARVWEGRDGPQSRPVRPSFLFHPLEEGIGMGAPIWVL